MKEQFQEALQRDLGRSYFLSEFAELGSGELEIEHVLEHFERWSKDISVDSKVICAPATSKIVNEPFGVALVMGSWNYPVMTVIQPLTYAIAAGNCAIIKPSEMAPNVSKLIKQLINSNLDSYVYVVLEGGGEVAATLTI